MKKNKFHFFALGALGGGLSGSDRIFIEFAGRWSKDIQINIYLWTEGYSMCKRQNLNSKNITFTISKMEPWRRFGFVINYFARIFEGLRLGFSIKLVNHKKTLVYSASDFWMDALPCFILKLRYPNIKWVATWYQTAPNPFRGFSDGVRKRKYKFKAFLYWSSQFFIKPIISNFADYVLVNNEEEKHQFDKLNLLGRVKVVLGAVDTKKINEWIQKNAKTTKIYDAVFQGRLHPQKGVIELIEIWQKVVAKRSDAKLAIIGDGPLLHEVKREIKRLKLDDNVKLFGYLFDGSEKYSIFSQSKIVVHPAFYDSGGMAAAEAMAFGLPCVGFDLKSYISYYPKGMIKIRIGNLKGFANEILLLLSNIGYRQKIGREASDMINQSWSWDTRAQEILGYVRD